MKPYGNNTNLQGMGVRKGAKILCNFVECRPMGFFCFDIKDFQKVSAPVSENHEWHNTSRSYIDRERSWIKINKTTMEKEAGVSWFVCVVLVELQLTEQPTDRLNHSTSDWFILITALIIHFTCVWGTYLHLLCSKYRRVSVRAWVLKSKNTKL